MRKKHNPSDVRYWQCSAIACYLMWLVTLTWTAWEATAGREGFWWELASWLVPVVILGAAVVMGAVLIGLYMEGRWQL